MENTPIFPTAEEISAVEPTVRATFMGVIAGLNCRAAVTVAMSYRKMTATRARIGGEDYIALPGVQPDALIGSISAFRTKSGALRLRVSTVTRSDGTENGWATLIPAGIRSLVAFPQKGGRAHGAAPGGELQAREYEALLLSKQIRLNYENDSPPAFQAPLK